MNNDDQGWMYAELPKAATRDEALRYFGIPPCPETDLVTNINAKRRRWHSRSNGPGGAELAKSVKETVRILENFLLKGLPLPANLLHGNTQRDRSRDLPPPEFSTIEQLSALIDALTERGQYQRAINTAREGLTKWSDSAEVAVIFSFAVATAAIADFQVQKTDLDEAIRTSEIATEIDSTNSTAWWVLSTLLAASGRYEEILLLEGEIVRKLGGIPVPTLLVIARVLTRTPDLWRGLEMVLRAVESDPSDAGIRLEATTIALDTARHMLPINSGEKVANFKKIVSVAAWSADGVASLEEIVRPFRMWAERSDQKMFTGSHRFRSFMSIITVFIWLPIHNLNVNKYLWEIILTGPVDGQLEFFAMSEMSYIQEVHKGVAFEWLKSAKTWPLRPVGSDLN